MKRLAIVAASTTIFFSTGCKHDENWSLSKSLGWEPTNKVATPSPVGVPRASLEVATRVEELGRKIVAQNTFLGVEPMFMSMGIPESVLFHVNSEQLYISQGLVEKCSTDAELAAVLSSELGKMVAEKRNAKALGRDVDPIPDAGYGGSSMLPGGTPYDAGQQANLAYHEKKYPRGSAQADSTATARDILKNAGYSPAELDRVEGLLKQSDRGELLRKQMGGSGPKPEWKK